MPPLIKVVTKYNKKTKAKPKAPANPYWKTLNMWLTPGGDTYTQQQYDKFKRIKDPTTLATLETWKQSCINCRVGYQDGEQVCKCIQHVCGYWWNSTQPRAGRCKTNDLHCGRCCRCIICNECGLDVTPRGIKSVLGAKKKKLFHNGCQCCNKCCKCKACVNCGIPVTHQCSACISEEAHHADCCDSDARLLAAGNKLLMIQRVPIFHAGGNFQANRIRRFLSIESEIDSYTKDSVSMFQFNSMNRTWKHSVVPDGTVPQGGEICTAPASGDKFLAVIETLQRMHTRIGSGTGVRCGMHVHVDARDYTYMDLINFLHLYYLVEPALFAILPPWRRINRFATPCRTMLLDISRNGDKLVDVLKNVEINEYLPPKERSSAMKRKPSISMRIAEKLYGTTTLMKPKQQHKNHDNQHIRYMAVNLHSWVYRRTIEFRHWPGSTNLQEMQLWPQICGALLEYAKRTPLAIIKQLPKEPVQALLAVLEQKSWISKGLDSFAEQQLSKWSPDWKEVWSLIKEADNPDTIHPLRKVSREGYALGFDIQYKLFTYISPQRCTWDYQWGTPMAAGSGRYATVNDLIAVPKGKINWVQDAPPPPKKATSVAIGAEMQLAYAVMLPPPVDLQRRGYVVPANHPRRLLADAALAILNPPVDEIEDDQLDF